MKTKIETVTYRLPAYWASYLINGDATGMEDAEMAAVDAFVKSVAPAYPVSCENYSVFDRTHDAFSFLPYAGATEEFTFHSQA